MEASKAQFDIRYADNWPDIAHYCRDLTRNRCVVCGGKAECVHHAYYALDLYQQDGSLIFLPIAGYEVPGESIFPCCNRCHKLLHTKVYWFSYRKNPVLGNRNYPKTIIELRQRFYTCRIDLGYF